MEQSIRKLLTGTIVAACGLPTVVYAQKAGKPNVIYILADDLGYGDLGCYGQQKIKTPNIDRMAADGIRFTQHYAGCTVSAPSRCALMTGKHTGHTYIRGNKGIESEDGRKYDLDLPAGEITLGEIFKQQGYATGCCGKWGMGAPGKEGHPNRQGFDYFYGYLGQGHAHSYYPAYLHENETEVKLGNKQYSHDLIEKKAVEFIRKNAGQPFFLYLSITLPHAEIHLPDEYRTDYENSFLPETPYQQKGGGYRSQSKPHATFAAMVYRIDLTIGRIEALLKELGLDEKTLVIFTSDNGPHQEGGADPKFFVSSGSYRGIKRDLYEGGIRVPMIARWPGTIAKGSVSAHPSAFWDVMPTFCELTGSRTPKSTDGLSFVPSLLGKKQKQHGYLYWEFHEQGGKQALLRGDWKLIRLQVKNPGKTRVELYNIKNDPAENDNLIDQYPDIVRKLNKIMDKARTENSLFSFRLDV